MVIPTPKVLGFTSGPCYCYPINSCWDKVQPIKVLLVQYWCFDQQEQLLGSLDNFEPEPPDTEDDEVNVLFNIFI